MVNYQEIYNNRKVFGGEPDRLESIEYSKYTWAPAMLQRMKDNHWLPEEVPLMDKDKSSFRELPEHMKRAFELNLARVYFTDGTQITNLGENLIPHLTANCLKQIAQRQEAEERNHTDSYLYIAMNVLDDPISIQTRYLWDEELQEVLKLLDRTLGLLFHGLNKFEQRAVQIHINRILEGLIFYWNFAFFYKLNYDTKKFSGTTTQISYINKDEKTHLDFWSLVFHEHCLERNVDKDKIKPFIENITKDAVWYESAFAHYSNNNECGFTNTEISQFIEYRADKLLIDIGYEPIYQASNPFDWFNQYAPEHSDVQKVISTFTDKSTNYQHKIITPNDLKGKFTW